MLNNSLGNADGTSDLPEYKVVEYFVYNKPIEMVYGTSRSSV